MAVIAYFFSLGNSVEWVSNTLRFLRAGWPDTQTYKNVWGGIKHQVLLLREPVLNSPQWDISAAAVWLQCLGGLKLGEWWWLWGAWLTSLFIKLCLEKGLGGGAETQQTHLYSAAASLLRPRLWQNFCVFGWTCESRVTSRATGMAFGFHCHLNCW